MIRSQLIGLRCLVAAVLAALAASALAACGPGSIAARPPSAPPDPSTSQAVGAGFYVTRPVDGELLPSDGQNKLVQPKVTGDFAGAPATNDWWSSLIWQFDRGGQANPYSEVMWPHPLALRAQRRGLEVAYPTEVEIDKVAYRYPFVADLLVSSEGLEAPDARVARYSDWTVTAAWGDGLRATFGHGMPFVYVESTGGKGAVVEALDAKGGAGWKLDGEVASLAIRGHHYAVFAPEGAKWSQGGGAIRSDLGGKGFYAVAALPDGEAATLALFRAHAHTFVTGGKVDWRYDAAHGAVASRFHFETEQRGGAAGTPIVALYRHQWQHTDAALLEQSYRSPRGPMKIAAASEFTTRLPYNGVMPVLPLVDGGDKGELGDLVEDAYGRGDLFPLSPEGKKDSYWTGKALGRLAILAQLADQAGKGGVRDSLVRAMENELEDWFDGNAPNLFYYDKTWHTLIGFPSAYFSSSQLNDHHFHYGYFILAAATVAAFDPTWASRDRYGGMVELLVRDAASWDRSDERFPFLRAFDAYAGHSWASGAAFFPEGNNEESSSEDVNFSVGVILWGAATGDAALRDLGVFLYANQVAAIEQYWFDVDGAVFPSGFHHPAIAILWGNGGRYDTWWDPSPVYVHGINFLPFTGGSLYLGRHPDYVARNWKALVDANRGEPLQWRDVLWMFLAAGQPDEAARRWAASHRFTPEAGNSMAWVQHWIATLAAAGTLDPAVTADAATALVLRRGNDRTYLAYNPESAPMTVRFSDGATLAVRPRAYAQLRRAVPGGRR